MPGVGEYKIAHVMGGSTNRSLIYRIATGIGDKFRRAQGNILIMPWTSDISPVSPSPIDFNMKFRIGGSPLEVRAFSDNFGPPNVILLKSEIFDSGIFDPNVSLDHRFFRGYVFARSILELIKKMSVPFPVVNCHGAQTGLLPFLIKNDELLKNEIVLYSVHHHETHAQEEDGAARFELDMGLFPTAYFERVKTLSGLLECGRELYYEDEISFLKAGIFFSDIAMVLHRQLLLDLFKNDPTQTNFFKRNVLKGKLTFLLGDNDMELNHARKAKKIIDIYADAESITGPFKHALTTSKNFQNDASVRLLISTGPLSGAGADRGALTILSDRLPGMSERSGVYPDASTDAKGSGSAIIRMLNHAKLMKDNGGQEIKPVIHLNSGGEDVLIGQAGIGLSEIALRLAGQISSQLKNGTNRWVLVLGNTTLFIPESRLMSGNSMIRYNDAGIFLFGFPVDTTRRSENDLNLISKQWGVIFADNDTGSIFSIRERPSLQELRSGAAISGGTIYLNLSNYAIRSDVASKILDKYYSVPAYLEGSFGLPFSETCPLHIVRHLLEPMMLGDGDSYAMTNISGGAGVWADRWENEGYNALGERISSNDWIQIYQNAQAIREISGGLAVGYGSGILTELRVKGGRAKLERTLNGEGANFQQRVMRMFFDIPETAPEEKMEVVVPLEEIVATPVPEASITTPAPSSGAPISQVGRGKVELFSSLAGSVIGGRMFLQVGKLIARTAEERALELSNMGEPEIRQLVLRMKKYVLSKNFNWSSSELGGSFLGSIPAEAFEEIPVEAIYGLYEAIEDISRRSFADPGNAHVRYYSCDTFASTFLVTVEPRAVAQKGLPASKLDLKTIAPDGHEGDLRRKWEFLSTDGSKLYVVYQLNISDLNMHMF